MRRVRLLIMCAAVAALAIAVWPSELPWITIHGQRSSNAGQPGRIDDVRPLASEVAEGRRIFRHDTFGDEQLWTDVLRMHEVIQERVSPMTALAVGLKVDSQALPPELVDVLQRNEVDLTDPAVTVTLLQLDAVVGLKGQVSDDGRLTSVGITCALCHSTVDDSFAPGIGKRLDGWANTTLNVGAIVGLSPAIDDDTREQFGRWGAGKYDPRHHAFDGTSIIPLNNPSVPVVIPPIYGLFGVGFETYTADGPISYWNTYVGVTQMGGHGSFRDPRIGLAIVQRPDRVAPKLDELLAFQLSLLTPEPPADSFDPSAARRGKQLFAGSAGCARCHQAPNFTDVLNGRRVPLLHEPDEVGMDDTYALRSATKKYRTTPLRALWQHPPYFHDGSAPDLLSVVNHYNRHFHLGLSRRERLDLVEFLKSI